MSQNELGVTSARLSFAPLVSVGARFHSAHAVPPCTCAEQDNLEWLVLSYQVGLGIIKLRLPTLATSAFTHKAIKPD